MNRRFASTILAVLAAGCATPVVRPMGWYCYSEATDGKFVTAVSVSLDANGRELGASASSRWESRGQNAWLRVNQGSYDPGSADKVPQLQLIALPAAKLRKQVAAVELGFGGAMGSLPGFRFARRQPVEPQYQLLPEMEAVLALARDRSGLEVAGFDRTGAALFRVPLDPALLIRGRAALRRAMATPHDAIRTKPGACRPLMPFSKEAIVIASARPLPGRSTNR
jgi:hypothetical protein